MKSAKTVLAVILLFVPTFATSLAFPQEANFSEREQNFREYITLLREDMKAERKDIITQMMQFEADDSAKFWPIFDKYDAELTKLGDGRTQLIIEYARHYENLTDGQANLLMNEAFDLEADRAMLKKRYFDKMKAVIGATQAAKFFLVENQMQHIVDLQVSAELPTVKTVSN